MQAIALGAWNSMTGTVAFALRGIASRPSGAINAHFQACLTDAAELRVTRERIAA